MNGCLTSISKLTESIVSRTSMLENCEIVLAPSHVYLDAVGKLLSNSHVSLSSQDISMFPSGAHTGEVSAEMVLDMGCRYAIIGHSERRLKYGETNKNILRKIFQALEHGIYPILCVGETKDEKADGKTIKVIQNQISQVFDYIGTELQENIIIAYEPVWAIGTGDNASANDIQNVLNAIRRSLGKLGSDSTLIYGGSINSENGATIFEQPDVDGGLIGGASLDGVKFSKLAQILQRIK